MLYKDKNKNKTIDKMFKYLKNNLGGIYENI